MCMIKKFLLNQSGLYLVFGLVFRQVLVVTPAPNQPVPESKTRNVRSIEQVVPIGDDLPTLNVYPRRSSWSYPDRKEYDTALDADPIWYLGKRGHLFDKARLGDGLPKLLMNGKRENCDFGFCKRNSIRKKHRYAMFGKRWHNNPFSFFGKRSNYYSVQTEKRDYPLIFAKKRRIISNHFAMFGKRFNAFAAYGKRYEPPIPSSLMMYGKRDLSPALMAFGKRGLSPALMAFGKRGLSPALMAFGKRGRLPTALDIMSKRLAQRNFWEVNVEVSPAVTLMKAQWYPPPSVFDVTGKPNFYIPQSLDISAPMEKRLALQSYRKVMFGKRGLYPFGSIELGKRRTYGDWRRHLGRRRKRDAAEDSGQIRNDEICTISRSEQGIKDVSEKILGGQKRAYERLFMSGKKRAVDRQFIDGTKRAYDRLFMNGKKRAYYRLFMSGKKRAYDRLFMNGKKRAYDRLFIGGKKREYDSLFMGGKKRVYDKLLMRGKRCANVGKSELRDNLPTPQLKELQRSSFMSAKSKSGAIASLNRYNGKLGEREIEPKNRSFKFGGKQRTKRISEELLIPFPYFVAPFARRLNGNYGDLFENIGEAQKKVKEKRWRPPGAHSPKIHAHKKRFMPHDLSRVKRGKHASSVAGYLSKRRKFRLP